VVVADVRYGSLAYMATLICDVRYTPKSRHGSEWVECLLCANRH
jgi:hypothetical protein